ncbi:MAG: hypothetical protein LUD76_07675 [Alistipes sp.]|nr:hypothetical protein [Alistipes sp.]
MASLRKLKRDVDYVVTEILSDCYLTIEFHPEKKDEVVAIMEKAVQLRNNLFQRANNPVEKNNASLVRKHYRQVWLDLFNEADELFSSLSAISQ